MPKRLRDDELAAARAAGLPPRSEDYPEDDSAWQRAQDETKLMVELAEAAKKGWQYQEEDVSARPCPAHARASVQHACCPQPATVGRRDLAKHPHRRHSSQAALRPRAGREAATHAAVPATGLCMLAHEAVRCGLRR